MNPNRTWMVLHHAVSTLPEACREEELDPHSPTHSYAVKLGNLAYMLCGHHLVRGPHMRGFLCWIRWPRRPRRPACSISNLAGSVSAQAVRGVHSRSGARVPNPSAPGSARHRGNSDCVDPKIGSSLAGCRGVGCASPVSC